MSYSTDLWCCISFLRKTYKTKEDVQEDLEEARSNIRAAKETITKLVYMTEPSKFFNFGSETTKVKPYNTRLVCVMIVE